MYGILKCFFLLKVVSLFCCIDQSWQYAEFIKHSLTYLHPLLLHLAAAHPTYLATGPAKMDSNSLSLERPCHAAIVKGQMSSLSQTDSTYSVV